MVSDLYEEATSPLQHAVESVSVKTDLEVGPEDVAMRGVLISENVMYIHTSVELGPEDVPLLERCPHFRGCYVQASMELGPKVSLLKGSSFQRMLCT